MRAHRDNAPFEVGVAKFRPASLGIFEPRSAIQDEPIAFASPEQAKIHQTVEIAIDVEIAIGALGLLEHAFVFQAPCLGLDNRVVDRRARQSRVRIGIAKRLNRRVIQDRRALAQRYRRQIGFGANAPNATHRAHIRLLRIVIRWTHRQLFKRLALCPIFVMRELLMDEILGHRSIRR